MSRTRATIGYAAAHCGHSKSPYSTSVTGRGLGAADVVAGADRKREQAGHRGSTYSSKMLKTGA